MSAYDPKRTLLLTYVAPSSAAARTSPGIEIASRFRRSSNTHVKSVVIATLPADRFISLCWKVADFWPISAEAGKKFCHQNCHRNSQNEDAYRRVHSEDDLQTTQQDRTQAEKGGNRRTALGGLQNRCSTTELTRHCETIYTLQCKLLPEWHCGAHGSRGGSFRPRSYQGNRVADFFSRASFCASAI
jgi:hypothetical protein